MKRNRLRTLFGWAILALSLAAARPLYSQEAANPGPSVRFAADIEAFLKEDAVHPPPERGILFVGSSIFRQWKSLAEDMAPLPVFNRAFGGSRTEEVLYYMDRIVLPYRPRIIVYYCGSNDINASLAPEGIFGRFRTFAERVARALPETRLFYVSINRAPQKKNRWAQVDQVNAMVREYCEGTDRVDFIDVNPVLFDGEGNPRMELYLSDRLHFQGQAYREFTRVIRPVLENSWQELRPKGDF